MKKITIMICLFYAYSSKGFTQISIKGPECVAAGLDYKYLIFGKIDSSTTVQICASGGSIVGSGGNCINGVNLNSLDIMWDSSKSNGNLTVSSSVGNVSFNVTIVSVVQGGIISESGKSQTISFNTVPVTIVCSAASAGNCNPKYSYQWQESFDAVNWSDIKNSKSENLKFPYSLKLSNYYRRKVVELSSGSIEYSDIATVFVIPALPTSSK